MPIEMTDVEREEHIAACADEFMQAMAKRDFETARIWLAKQTLAVLDRTKAQVLRMEQERGLVR